MLLGMDMEDKQFTSFDVLNNFVENKLKGTSFYYLKQKVDKLKDIFINLEASSLSSAQKKVSIISFFKSLNYSNDNLVLANYIIILFFVLSIKIEHIPFIRIMMLKKCFNAVMERAINYLIYDEDMTAYEADYALNINFIDEMAIEKLALFSTEEYDNSDEQSKLEMSNVVELLNEMRDWYVNQRFCTARKEREKNRDNEIYFKYFKNPIEFFNKYKNSNFENIPVDFNNDDSDEVVTSLFESGVDIYDNYMYGTRLQEGTLILEGLGRWIRKGMDKIIELDRKISDTIDANVDHIRDKAQREKRKRHIEEILRGQDYGMKLSSLIKITLAGLGIAKGIQHYGGVSKTIMFPALKGLWNVFVRFGFSLKGVSVLCGLLVAYATNNKIKARQKMIMKKKVQDAIEIIDEKINDANAAGKKEIKYKLMKARQKMENTIHAFDIGASPAQYNDDEEYEDSINAHTDNALGKREKN